MSNSVGFPLFKRPEKDRIVETALVVLLLGIALGSMLTALLWCAQRTETTRTFSGPVVTVATRYVTEAKTTTITTTESIEFSMASTISSDATPTATPTASSEWALIIDGFVDYPLSLSLQDIINMPSITVSARLYCAPSTTVPVEEGNWTGVRLEYLLEKAGVSPNAVKVAFYAEDGFATDLTVTAAMHEDVILAYEKDSEPLPQKLRLVVPGRWGYKWIHSIAHIELVEYDFKGTYESIGFPDEAIIPVNSEESKVGASVKT